MSSTTAYKILGCSANSTLDEIRLVYLRLAKQHHPDKNRGDDAKFLEIQHAWETIRQEHQVRRAPPQQVDLDEMTFFEQDNAYRHQCRCGDSILARGEELEQGINTFACPSCSLSILVCFEVVSEDE